MHGEAEKAFREFREQGRPRAMARVFDLTAQELLLVAANLARDGEEAEELVQVTYLEALRRRASWDAARPLLPWLLGILLRQQRALRRERAARRGRERALEPEALASERDEDPAVRAEEAELAATLAAAIASLPESYRDGLTLRLVHGLEPVQIAHALGRPLETVRTQLRRGKELLRDALPRSLAGLVLFAPEGWAAVRRTIVEEARRAGAAIGGGGIGGVLAMNAKAITVGVLVLVGAGLWRWRTGAGPAESVPSEPGAVAVAAPAVPAPAGLEPAARGTQAREVLPSEPRPGGSALGAVAELLCRVVWDSDGTPAAGVRLELWHQVFRDVTPHPRATSDASGMARFPGLQPGEAFVFTDRFDDPDRRGMTTLAAGTNELELRIPRGLEVEGLVLDEHDRSVAHAQLWLAGRERYDGGGSWTEQADARGRFRLRDVASGHSLAARAPGRAAGTEIVLEGEPGDVRQVTLRVGASGPRVRGIVRARGVPIAGALVFLGSTQDTRFTIVDGVKTLFVPPPQWLGTDEAGHFEGECVPEGQLLPVWASAEGFATWHENVPMSGDPFVEIELERAAAVFGVLHDDEGRLVASGHVGAIQRGLDPERAFDHGAPSWARGETWSASDGSFRLERLHPGPLTLFATEDTREARAELELAPGQERRWDPVLRAGQELAGIVVDEQGVPLSGIQVRASSEGLRPHHHLPSDTTDSDGWFRLDGAVRDAYTLRLSVECDLDTAFYVQDIAPGGGELELVFPASFRPSARLVGRLLDPGGAPFTPESLRLRRIESDSTLRGGGHGTRCEAGAFETGPLPPGRYVLTIRDETTGSWQIGPFELAAGEVRDVGAFRASAPGGIECRVLDVDGSPLSSGDVFAVQGPDVGASAPIFEGRAHFATLASGTYWVGFTGYGEPLIRTPVEVRAGAVSEVTLRLPAALPRWIQVPDGPPRSFTVCAFEWWRDGALAARCDTLIGPDRQRPVAMCLAPGHYEVVVSLENGRSATTSFEVSAATTDEEQAVVLRSPFDE